MMLSTVFATKYVNGALCSIIYHINGIIGKKTNDRFKPTKLGDTQNTVDYERVNQCLYSNTSRLDYSTSNDGMLGFIDEEPICNGSDIIDYGSE